MQTWLQMHVAVIIVLQAIYVHTISENISLSHVLAIIPFSAVYLVACACIFLQRAQAENNGKMYQKLSIILFSICLLFIYVQWIMQYLLMNATSVVVMCVMIMYTPFAFMLIVYIWLFGEHAFLL